MKTNKRSIGTQYEALAESYLTKRGVQILERNYYFRGGEIDLIARDQEVLCFIEVKYRKTTAMGFPEEAIGSRKQQRMQRGAVRYLYEHGITEATPCRFDVISILNTEIRWLKNIIQ